MLLTIRRVADIANMGDELFDNVSRLRDDDRV